MIRRLPRSTRTDTLFPYPTLFRSPALSATSRTLRAALFDGHLHADPVCAGAGTQQYPARDPGRGHARARFAGVGGLGGGGRRGGEAVGAAARRSLTRAGRAACDGIAACWQHTLVGAASAASFSLRSDERRVGEGCVSNGRSRWSPSH